MLESPSGYDADRDDSSGSISAARFLAEARWIAPDFESYLYRDWIETASWHEAVIQQRPWPALSPDVRGYLRHYIRRDPPILDEWPAPFPADGLRESASLPGQGLLW